MSSAKDVFSLVLPLQSLLVYVRDVERGDPRSQDAQVRERVVAHPLESYPVFSVFPHKTLSPGNHEESNHLGSSGYQK